MWVLQHEGEPVREEIWRPGQNSRSSKLKDGRWEVGKGGREFSVSGAFWEWSG